ncbi:MAG TPA: glycosyltransferase, partial [Thermoanaerobaculia bacterium]|nr:glycosyltransferase [Thermoanaerobaculia bacterium]
MARSRFVTAVRRLLGRPPTDWMGEDPARRACAGDTSMPADNRHEIVALPGSGPDDAAALRRLAAQGHRVFLVSPRASAGTRPYELSQAGPRLYDVALPPARCEGLDALRRDRGLGATVCVASDPAWAPLAQRLRSEQNWPTVEAVSPAMAEAFPLLSIIVVTFNNRDLNRLCLDSLVARTEWPNREILVVDNDSTDGTRALLEQAGSAHAGIRAILLDENRGYPAAVNVGLEHARGRNLVLLNNDTVVTRGWATALLRHLARDGRLGLVGPVTNAIANAARTDVGYADLEGLPAWAARFTQEHDGETFPIATLAFFCAAMRRDVYEQVG